MVLIDFHLTSVSDERDLKLLKEFMFQQPQFYPDFKKWVDEKCCPRIESGDYKTIIVLSQGILVGDSVYRKLNENDIEIKNFRIDSQYRNRDLGHFLLRQLVCENPNKNLLTDIAVDNFQAVKFFIRNGFEIFAKQQLYLQGQDEYLIKLAA